MCLAVAVDIWGLVIAVVSIGGVNIGVIALFLRHLRAREHSCHDFQRQINDSTREAFKSIIATLYETRKTLSHTRKALTTSSEVILNAMAMMQQWRDEDARQAPDKGTNI